MFSSLLGFLGGLGIFLYGAHLLSNSLQKLGASKMREYLATITDTRIKGMLSGIVVTFFLQSSTVTNIIVVGLVGSAVLTLTQGFGVVLGATIGTTLTVQILTFNVSQFAPVFIFLGVVLIMFIRNHTSRSIGQIVLAIGFIFFGIGLITSSLEPLSEHEHVLEFLITLSNKPVLFAIIAIVLTALMHSSAATIIIGIAFVTSDVLSLSAVLPLVLGANIGTTLPVVISSLASRAEGKKLALFYFSIKVIGVTIAMLFLTWISKLVPLLPGSPERQIAHFHTLFNIGVTVLFFPLLPYVAKLFHRLFPQAEEGPTFEVNLDDRLLDIPEEALNNSRHEIIRLANMVKEKMIYQLKNYIEGTYTKEQLEEVEDIINDSYIQIQQYLLRLGQRDLSRSQSDLEVKLLNILNDIEHIGDMVMRFLRKGEELKEKNIQLNEDDRKQLKTLLSYIEKTYERSLYAFKHDERDVARSNIQNQSIINQFEKDIKFEHFNSLIIEHEYNPEISGVYLDIINELLQVYHHSINISRTVLGLI